MGTRFWAFAPLEWKGAALGGAMALSLFCLAGCDSAPSAVAARTHGSGDGLDRRLADSAPDGDNRAAVRQDGGYGSPAVDHRRDADTPLFHGKPIWAANKNHSGQENADYHFKRDGDAVGAASEDDFLTKVHAFVDDPPKSAEVLTRANGDRLIYDPKANLFAVADKSGAPRTLFKPRDGAAYWEIQKQSVAKGEDFATERRSQKRSSDGDNG
jgi:pyocin large subunit-like protein